MWKTGKRQAALSCKQTHLRSAKKFVRAKAYGALRTNISMGLDGLPAPRLICDLRIGRPRYRVTFDFVNLTAGLTFLLSRNPAGVPGVFTLWFCSGAYIIQTTMAGISDTCPVGRNLSRHFTPAGISNRHRRSAFCPIPRCNTVSLVTGAQCVSDSTVLCFNFFRFRMSINDGNSILGTVNRSAGIRNDFVEK